MSRSVVVIHTDGSASVKDKSGGWGFVARFESMEERRSGCACGTTISVMELLAINKALHFLKPNDIPVRIYSDSKYAVNCLMEWGPIWEKHGWITATGKPVSNVDIIQSTLRLIERHREFREISIEWIKGHNGTADNEIADNLAGTARRARKGTWKPEDKKFHKLADEISSSTETPSINDHGQHHQTEDRSPRPRFRTPRKAG